MKTEVFCFLDDWGGLIGSILVYAPVVYDILMLGFRRFYDWNIGYWGIVCICIGGIMSLLTHFARKW